MKPEYLAQAKQALQDRDWDDAHTLLMKYYETPGYEDCNVNQVAQLAKEHLDRHQKKRYGSKSKMPFHSQAYPIGYKRVKYK